MARVKILVRPSGYLNIQEWPEVGEELELPDAVAETMAGAGHVEILPAARKVEKRPASTAKVEKRG